MKLAFRIALLILAFGSLTTLVYFFFQLAWSLVLSVIVLNFIIEKVMEAEPYRRFITKRELEKEIKDGRA